jgi:hypothetical protein
MEQLMKSILPLFLLAFAISTPATAEIKGCYKRVYDVGVLKRHPKQMVTGMVFRIGVPPNDQEGLVDDLSFEIRGSKHLYLSTYDCKYSPTAIVCTLTPSDGAESVAGQFVIKEIKNGVVVNPQTDLKVGDLDTEKPFTLPVKSNPEHATFTLRKVNVDFESCGF